MKASICPVADVPAEGTRPVSFFGRDYLVYRAGGEPRAVFNACVHLGGPLERRGDHFVCPWHGATFDAATGRCAHGPQGTQAGLLVLPTRVEDGMLTYVYGE